MALIKYLNIIVAFLAILLWLGAGPKPDETRLPPPPGEINPEPRAVTDTALLDQGVYCPVQVEGAKEVVLLVHGTGMT